MTFLGLPSPSFGDYFFHLSSLFPGVPSFLFFGLLTCFLVVRFPYMPAHSALPESFLWALGVGGGDWEELVSGVKSLGSSLCFWAVKVAHTWPFRTCQDFVFELSWWPPFNSCAWPGVEKSVCPVLERLSIPCSSDHLFALWLELLKV